MHPGNWGDLSPYGQGGDQSQSGLVGQGEAKKIELKKKIKEGISYILSGNKSKEIEKE